MKRVLWSITLGLGCLGGLLVLMALVLLANPDLTDDDREAALGLIVLATPPLTATAGLGWGLYSHQRQARKQQQAAESEALRRQFYQLVQAHQGRLTVLQFAAATNLSGAEAKQYLDERAQEFGADFSADAPGEISYHFPL